MGRSVIVRKGGSAESHINHGPGPEAVEALRIIHFRGTLQFFTYFFKFPFLLFLDLPDVFMKTLAGDLFLLYDSINDYGYALDCARILIFATCQNLKLLFESQIRFLDGTFDVVPTFFLTLYSNGKRYSKVQRRRM